MANTPYAADAEQEITVEELEYLEARYQTEKDDHSITADTQFFYAWGLIRSKYQDDKVSGISLLRDTLEKWPERKRECIYYIAVGEYRLGNYRQARKYVEELLMNEPGNQQALSLKNLIDSKSSKEGVVGLALIGGILAATAGILIAGFRSRSRQ